MKQTYDVEVRGDMEVGNGKNLFRRGVGVVCGIRVGGSEIMRGRHVVAGKRLFEPPTPPSLLLKRIIVRRFEKDIGTI